MVTSCGGACGIPRELCGHPCSQTCHPGQDCPKVSFLRIFAESFPRFVCVLQLIREQTWIWIFDGSKYENFPGNFIEDSRYLVRVSLWSRVLAKENLLKPNVWEETKTISKEVNDDVTSVRHLSKRRHKCQTDTSQGRTESYYAMKSAKKRCKTKNWQKH